MTARTTHGGGTVAAAKLRGMVKTGTVAGMGADTDDIAEDAPAAGASGTPVSSSSFSLRGRTEETAVALFTAGTSTIS